MKTPAWLSVLVLAILLGCTSAAPGEGSPTSMPTWEYKVVALTEDPQHIEKTFNALSGQGWEFAGAVRTRGEGPDCGVFKRPKR